MNHYYFGSFFGYWVVLKKKLILLGISYCHPVQKYIESIILVALILLSVELSGSDQL